MNCLPLVLKIIIIILFGGLTTAEAVTRVAEGHNIKFTDLWSKLPRSLK